MAKRFRFKLEVVERVRRQEYDRLRRKVSEAVRAVQEVEGHVDRLNDQIRRSLEERIASRQGGTVDVARVRTHEFHRGWLQRHLAEAELGRAERARALDRERQALAEATRRLRVIEKLREKQWQRHLREVRREEQVMTDETALTRYLRTSAPAGGVD